jgi:hypothetical protein
MSACEETWRLVGIIDRPLFGDKGALKSIREPIHEGSMDDHYLRLSERWLREAADTIAKKRADVLIKQERAA